MKEKKFIKINSPNNLFFYFALFLLPTAPFISLVIILPLSFIYFFKNIQYILKDPWSKLFILSGIFMIISSFYQFFTNSPYFPLGDKMMPFVGLFNWIPFFIFFSAFQNFLITETARYRSSLFLVSGTIPLLISAIGQYFFKWHGPFSTLNGLIVWFQRPIDWIFIKGATGVFNNSNYLATWLLMIFPFALTLLFKPFINKFEKLTLFIINLIFSLVIFLTMSRNAWIGFFITIISIIGSKALLFIAILIFTITFIISLNFLQIELPINILNIALPEFIKIRDISSLLQFQRLYIWAQTIQFIAKSPLFGLGAGTFAYSLVINDIRNIAGQHTHNLFLEVTYNYGLFASITLFIGFITLIIKNFSIKKDLSVFDKAWFVSSGLFLFIHLSDVTYYDLRIGTCAWILFAGMCSIIKNNQLVKKTSRKIF